MPLIDPGQKAPAFALKDQHGRAHRLSDYAGRPVILYFYPKDQHPKVAEAAAIGLPDPDTGERCCAVVACRDPKDPLGFDEMVAFLEAQDLMRQKLPERLEIVDALPRNPTGKVLKAELRARYAS